MQLKIEERDGLCSFRVYVSPRGRRDEIVGLHGEAMRVRLVAVPEKGKANQALVRFIARQLGVPATAVAIVSGHTSRHKRVQVNGVTPAHIRSAFDPLLEEHSRQ